MVTKLRDSLLFTRSTKAGVHHNHRAENEVSDFELSGYSLCNK